MRVWLCSIQQSAATALGRLANYSDDLAEAVVQNEIIPQLVSCQWKWASLTSSAYSTLATTLQCIPQLIRSAPLWYF